MAIQDEIQFEQLPVWCILYGVRARANDKRLLIGKSSWNIHNVIYSRWWQHLLITCQPKTNQLWDHRKRVFSLHGNDSYNSINGEKSSMIVKHTQRGRNSYFRCGLEDGEKRSIVHDRLGQEEEGLLQLLLLYSCFNSSFSFIWSVS